MRRLPLATIFVLASSCAVTAHADTFGSGENTFDIEFVTIGNPGNPDDTTGKPNPAGKVEYTYRIGKYEISDDMIDKANTEGDLGITYLDFPGVDKPATDITWFEAAQFVNLLNTDSGRTPAYKFNGGTFELWQPGDAGYDSNNLFRNSQARYVLPSIDEWYKAAYYDPVAEVYYDYPTGSDSEPDGIDFAGDTTFDAVFHDGGFNPAPNDITDVGVLSPYGTAGQGGNVFESGETELDLVNDSSSSFRSVRGGDWRFPSWRSLSSARSWNDPKFGHFNLGFRVASIPEPSSLLLATLAAVGLLLGRRRRR